VEFFCEEKDVIVIEKRTEVKGGGWVHYFACNNEVNAASYMVYDLSQHFRQGELRTNVPDDGRNVVTWGIFPAKEIIQTTIIERESFLSWKVTCAKAFAFCHR